MTFAGPSAPNPITRRALDPYSINITWQESIDVVSEQQWLFDNRFQFWYEIDYNYTNGTEITTGLINTTTTYTHHVTGLPGPSSPLNVNLVAVLDCGTSQGRINSFDTGNVLAYTGHPFCP